MLPGSLPVRLLPGRHPCPFPFAVRFTSGRLSLAYPGPVTFAPLPGARLALAVQAVPVAPVPIERAQGKIAPASRAPLRITLHVVTSMITERSPPAATRPGGSRLPTIPIPPASAQAPASNVVPIVVCSRPPPGSLYSHSYSRSPADGPGCRVQGHQSASTPACQSRLGYRRRPGQCNGPSW